jgi:hypothetical protein
MDKKEKIKALETHFGVKAKYLSVPSFAYQIQAGEEIYTITREGTIQDRAGRPIDLSAIINGTDPVSEGASLAEADQGLDAVEIALPLTGHTGISLKNLINMIFSKQTLIQKALLLEDKLIDETLVKKLSETKPETMENFKALLLEAGHDKCPGISFDFEQGLITFKLRLTSPEQIKAVSDLIGLINVNAINLKHASSKPNETDNPKYAFRTWLLRLGMIGDDFKNTRKLLLANLEGNGAFRKPKEEAEIL